MVFSFLPVNNFYFCYIYGHFFRRNSHFCNINAKKKAFLPQKSAFLLHLWPFLQKSVFLNCISSEEIKKRKIPPAPPLKKRKKNKKERKNKKHHHHQRACAREEKKLFFCFGVVKPKVLGPRA